MVEYREQFDTLAGVATMILGSRGEGEEVVQDAFIAVVRNWASVQQVRPYLRRAVVNGAYGVLRRRRRSEAAVTVDHAPGDAPAALVELRDLLLGLPDRQRIVLVLRHLEDLPDAEIAEALGCRWPPAP